MAKRGQDGLYKRNHNAYNGNNRNLIEIKFSDKDHTDGFYILLISGAVIHGGGKDRYLIPSDAQKMLIREGIEYEVLK